MLTSLEVLQLEGNRLTDLPAGIHQLTTLKTLGLARNAFMRFPEAACELVGLEVLQLNGNKLTELPPTVSQVRRRLHTEI